MALMKIITEPDPRYRKIGPRLRQKSEKIEVIDDAVRQLAADMLETMMDANGAGLAAPQVGILKRLIIVHVPAGYENDDDPEMTLTLVNPEIVRAGGQQVGLEGCLSFPELWGEVPRYMNVTVRARNLDGRDIKIRAHGYLSRALQHEIDHLDGILYFDRMEDPTALITSEQLLAEQEREERAEREQQALASG
jgi:peptide deformylase